MFHLPEGVPSLSGDKDKIKFCPSLALPIFRENGEGKNCILFNNADIVRADLCVSP